LGKKILLADDSITIQKVIELTFSDEDFEVVTVGNGRLAIERLPEARPDLVLCDIIMPEKDGYEVCDFIKKHPALSHIPVLLLTGAFEPFDQEKAARVGCDGFLAKPFEPQTLIAKVKELLAQAGSKPGVAAAAVSTSATQAAPASFAPSSPRPAPVFRAPEPGPEPADDDFASGKAFGEGASGTAAYSPGADIGTVRSPAFRATDEDRFPAPPASLDELYDDDPYGASNDLMPLSDDEAESVSTPPPDSPGEPAPWSQPTVEVPLEMRAQAGVESAQLASEGFEEVFDEESSAPPSPARLTPSSSAGRETSAPSAPTATSATPSMAPSSAAPPTVKEGFGWGRDADVPAPAVSPKESPDSSFRDVAPAEEEEQTPISRSVAGEVQVPVDMVEKIAQRVVAQISEKVIREIAWEVIPDLAEALIKREIDRLKAELQQT
jgi:CheY-like chemotaxis protein